MIYWIYQYLIVFKDLYERDFKLRSDYRPSIRFLYHYFLISIPVSVRIKIQGKAQKQEQLPGVHISWRRAEKHLDRNMSSKTGAHLGDMEIAEKHLHKCTVISTGIREEESRSDTQDLAVYYTDLDLLGTRDGGEEGRHTKREQTKA